MDIDALREDLVLDARLRGHSFRLNTTWGLFSPRAVDAGTLLLLERLEIPANTVALDLGCGYGPDRCTWSIGTFSPSSIHA